MIWFNHEFTLNEQPPGAVVRLTGTYNPSDSNLSRILVRLHIEPGSENDTIIIVNVFEKNPSMLAYEEPDADQVYEKYRHNVQKLVSKFEKMSYGEVIVWSQSQK